MWRFVFIVFLIAQGLIHVAMWVLVPKPASKKEAFDASHSWLLGNQRAVAAATAAVTSVILVIAGVGLWANAEWWRGAAVVGMTTSFLLMVVYFNPWFTFFQAVNAGLVAAIGWMSWPSEAMVGA